MNHTLHRFVCNLIEELKEVNDDREYHNKYHNKEDHKQILDIPFIISSLYQSFENKEEKYKEFIFDLEKWCNYWFVVKNPSDDDWYKIISIYVDSYDTEYHYELNFYYDERNYGYCECTPDMPDYREDKKCCGHGCDANFCTFELKKVIDIAGGSWQGDEHDYWEFEDSFYKADKAALEEKERQMKESRIKELKNRIEADTKKLMELEKEYESRTN